MCAEDFSRFRLQVVADSDPGAITRVLERFHTLNIMPRRIHAELASNDLLHVEIDVFGVDSVKRRLIAAKLTQAICVLTIHWHEL
jgi:hypothetical protein